MPTREEWSDEIGRRRAAFRAVLEDHGCEAGLVFSAQGHNQSFRYLTNFTPVLGDMWAVVGSADPIDCVLNFAWQLEEASGLPPGDRWSGDLDAVPLVTAAVAELGPRRLGVDGFDRLPLRAAEAIRRELPEVEPVDVGGAVSALRRRKSALEIELLREAARITDAVLDAARTELRPGLTEKEVAASLGVVAQRLGGQWAFPPCVQADREHAPMIREPTGRRLETGHAVMIDVGAEWEGYQADAARTFVLGQPSELQQRAWDTVLRAYEAAQAKTRPGVRCREVHEAARRVIEEAGFSLPHRIGHGIGLGLSFEWPSLDTEEAELEPGMTICLEPGVYAPGAGSMKFEDDVLVTDEGCEVLTRSPRTLEVAG